MSLTSVQKELGRGSFTTVKRLFDVWLLDHPEQTVPQLVPLAALPDRLAAQLETATRGLWTAATEVAETRLQTEREGYRQQVVAAEVDRDAAAEVVDALASTNETLTEQVSELQEQFAETQQRGRDADAARTVLEGQLAQEREAGQTAAALAATQEEHNADLKSELDQQRATVASERHHHADALKHAQEQAEQRVLEVRADLERQVADGRERAEGAATEVRVIREGAEATALGLRQQLDQVRSEAAQAQGALTTMREQLETQTRLLEQALAHSTAPEAK
ncbi:DNA-binding protein [Deinococcus marmoris]